MPAQIFALKIPLLIPIAQTEDRGRLFFQPGDFGLGYSGFQPDPEKKELSINLTVRRTADGVEAYLLKNFRVTEEGFESSSPINMEDIEAAQSQQSTLLAGIEIGESEERTWAKQLEDIYSDMARTEDSRELEALKKQADDTKKELGDVRSMLGEKRQQLQQLVVPPIRYARIFRYSDVIQWFDKEGRLLPEAIPYALQIRFMGRPIGDFIEAQPV